MEQQYYKQKKILLVDDEKALLDMVADFLREDGYTQIKTAGTVAAAIDAAKTWKPDFAILDVMLPDGDGFSLFERLRAFTKMPVLFLTARGEDEDRLRGLGLGADDYMVKPFLPRELLLRNSSGTNWWKRKAAHIRSRKRGGKFCSSGTPGRFWSRTRPAT